MSDLATVYHEHADRYEQMIRTEDFEGNLLPAIQAICPLDGIAVMETGAGTGRVTRLLAPSVQSIRSVDREVGMLRQAQAVLPGFGVADPALALGDHRALPFPAGCADLVIQGWSFLHLKLLYPETWREEMRRAHDEMVRVLRPGGTILHIETLGTGHVTPAVPTDFRELYDWWEGELDFRSTWIRTDYRFASWDDAEALTVFFFGDEIRAAFVEVDGQPELPECTGLWWRTV